jgi:hypothetical protein
MANTPFSEGNKDFSDRAHALARKVIYPTLFNAQPERLAYEEQEAITTARGALLDADMSIDRVVRVTVAGFRQPLVFTVQERFRQPKYVWNRDITLTEWNEQSNQPSEFYKISANLFLYAYYDDVKQQFLDAICVNVPAMMLAFAKQSLDFERAKNPRTNQPFIGVKFDALHEQRLVVYRMKNAPALPQLIRQAFSKLGITDQLRLISDLTGDMAKVAVRNKEKAG